MEEHEEERRPSTSTLVEMEDVSGHSAVQLHDIPPSRYNDEVLLVTSVASINEGSMDAMEEDEEKRQLRRKFYVKCIILAELCVFVMAMIIISAVLLVQACEYSA